MLQDISRDIKAYLYDRARSPLFAAFAASWVGWNFRGIVILFSGLTVADKFDEWRTIYVGEWELWARLLIYPFLTCLAFIALYPWPARLAFWYWHWHHTKVKAIQQRLEDETPLTQEEARTLRASAIEQQVAMREQIERLGARLREVAKERDAAVEQISQATSRATESETQVRHLTEANKGLMQQIEKLSEDLAAMRRASDAQRSEPRRRERAIKTRDDSDFSAFREEYGNLSDNAARAFLGLALADGKAVDVPTMATAIDESRLDTQAAFKELARFNLVNFDGDAAALTSTGVNTAIKHGFTRKRK